MFKFDLMKFIGFRGNRIYFRSKTKPNVCYFFEFSWKHIKFIFNITKTKYIGLVTN